MFDYWLNLLILFTNTLNIPHCRTYYSFFAIGGYQLEPYCYQCLRVFFLCYLMDYIPTCSFVQPPTWRTRVSILGWSFLNRITCGTQKKEIPAVTLTYDAISNLLLRRLYPYFEFAIFPLYNLLFQSSSVSCLSSIALLIYLCHVNAGTLFSFPHCLPV